MDDYKPKILCISTTPQRCFGSSDKMLRTFARHVVTYGGDPTIIRLAEMNIAHCDACYSKNRRGDKCKWPCIHMNDDTHRLLEMIVEADGYAIATPVHWLNLCSLAAVLVSKMTSIENNRAKIRELIGREPLYGKYVVVMASYEGDGATRACEAITTPLNHMGIGTIGNGMIIRPSILNRISVRIGMWLLGEKKCQCVPNWLRLGARNLVALAKFGKEHPFNDDKVEEERT